MVGRFFRKILNLRYVMHSFSGLNELDIAICSPLMIVAEIAHLTHAERVDESVSVLAFSGPNISPKSTVAGTAKVLSVVPSLGVLALSDTHRPSSLGREKWVRCFNLVNCDGSNLPLDRGV